MTIMQQKLIKNLKTSKTLKEAGDKAGYATNNGSRAIYRECTKRHIAEALKVEPESIKAHYEMLYDLCLSDDDKATAKGILDSLCRITGMNKDRTDISIKYAPDKVSISDFNSIHGQLTDKTPVLSQKSDIQTT